MTDHTIEANFVVNGAMLAGHHSSNDQRVIEAMAKAIGGENASHPHVVFEATKIYLAVSAMREAMAKEAS